MSQAAERTRTPKTLEKAIPIIRMRMTYGNGMEKLLQYLVRTAADTVSVARLIE
jgi:hypothetical protein